MKAKLIIEGKEFEVEISKEEYKKIQTTEEKKTGYERVSEGSGFFYISSVGVTTYGLDQHEDIDDSYYETGNYYSSVSIAENNARADRLMRRLRRFAVKHRKCGIDWHDINNNKYYIYGNFETNSIDIGINTFLRDFGVIYFDSKETAQAAIDEFHDELIWYFTEYKDSL